MTVYDMLMDFAFASSVDIPDLKYDRFKAKA